MVLGNQGAFVNSERIRHNVLKIKGIVVLRFSKTGDPHIIFYPIHPEMPVEVVKIPLQRPVIEREPVNRFPGYH